MLNHTYCVYGMAKSGLATARAIINAGGIVYCGDDKNLSERTDLPKGVQIFKGNLPDNLTALILSPGIPMTYPAPHDIVVQAQKHDIPVWCDIELFYRTYHNRKNVKFIAVTGTNGKSTVTALTAYLLKSMGQTAYACGNIGTAMFDVPSPDMHPDNENIYYVIEISSYQADLCDAFQPDAVAFLNLTPDHIDRHGDIEGYFNAKMRLFKHTPYYGTAVVIQNDEYARRAKAIAKHTYAFTDDEYTKIRNAIQSNLYLRGNHNFENALAAYALVRGMGFDGDDICMHFADYVGLPHRCEYVGKKSNVVFINDSKATNAQATEMALLSYDNIYWLAGGIAKADGIEPLVPCLEYVNHVFVYGQDHLRFTDTLKHTKKEFSVYHTMLEAFDAAWNMAAQDSEDAVVLLSPAAASFDAFKNFEHRGEVFKQLVHDL